MYNDSQSDSSVVIVASADNRYAMPLAVLLKSAAINLSPKSTLQAFILDGGISAWNRARVERSVAVNKINISWIPVREAKERLSGVPVFGHVSPATYFRLLIADLLPLSFTRAIYLDVDAVVLSDLTELWGMELNGCSLGAVPDGELISTGKGTPGFRDYGIEPDVPRFNGGVLLMDLKRWREHDMANRCIAYLEKYHEQIQFWDQDALNIIFAKDWVGLPASWNYRVDCHTTPDADRTVDVILSELKSDADIIHYASATKPWHYYADHPGKALFFEYLDKTEWRGWHPCPPLRTLCNRHYWGGLIRRWKITGWLWELLHARRDENQS
jgi:lipopolysaccharide biosynthesis glycosyltransferase